MESKKVNKMVEIEKIFGMWENETLMLNIDQSRSGMETDLNFF